jgi:hypothetical protein
MVHFNLPAGSREPGAGVLPETNPPRRRGEGTNEFGKVCAAAPRHLRQAAPDAFSSCTRRTRD